MEARRHYMYGPFLTRSRNVDTAWRTIVSTVLEKGAEVYTERKKQKTLECLSTIVHLTDWRTGSITPQNYIGLSPEVIEQQYWPQYSTLERGEHTYTYGWCMKKRFGFNQIQHVVDTLKRGEKTAFAQFWNPIVDSKSPDPPCIDIVAFQRSNGKINLVEYIRSNDIARAWPEDVSGSYAVFLTEVAANFGGASARGDILTMMGSAHVYDTAIQEIQERFQSSYTLSNPKPMENTSTLLGPIIKTVRAGEKCSTVTKAIAERYSRVLDEDSSSLYVCLDVHNKKLKEKSAASSETAETTGKLAEALEHYISEDDNGEQQAINQVEWAAVKVESTPESRRIVLTPNNPFKSEYSINPVIIQFLIREKKLHTVALYTDARVDRVDRDFEDLLKISRKVVGRKGDIKLGQVIMMLAPISL
jgi:thymidylate synthase